MGIKKFLLSKAFIGSAIGVAAAAVVTAAIVFSQAEAYRLIKVFDFAGTASVERGEEKAITPFKGMNLESGDCVSVFENSNMQLNLDEDKYITLEENTVIDLIATGTPADSKTEIYLSEGEIFNEITKPLSENSSYVVNTPKATMAVRGTSFRVSVERYEEESYITEIEVITGKVEIQLLDENGKPKDEPILLTAGQSILIKTDPTSSNDATVDGNSFFVIYDAEKGEYIPMFGNEDAEVTTSATTVAPETSTAEETTTTATTTVTASSNEDTPIIEGNANGSTVITATVTTQVPTSTKLTTTTEKATTTSKKTTTTTEKATTTTKKVTTTTEKSVTTTAKMSTTTKKVFTSTPIISFTTTTTTAAPVSSTTTTTTTAEETPEAITYVVKFVDSSNNVISSVEVEEGGTVTSLPDVPKHAAYAEGTYTSKWVSGDEDFTTSTVITADTTVTAKYTLKEYTVEFIKDGTSIKSETLTYNQTLTFPEVTTTTGYTGIWTSSDGTEYNNDDVSTVTITVADDLTFTYTETINSYTVTVTSFATSDELKKDSFEYSTIIDSILPEKPAEGIWKYSDGTAYTSGDKVTDITEIYFIPTYTANFYDASAADMEAEKITKTVEYGATISSYLPEKPSGVWVWYDDASDCDTSATITGDIAIVFLPNYTVTFNYTDTNGNSAVVDVSVEQYSLFEDVTAPTDVLTIDNTDPNNPTYFAGWKNGETEMTDSDYITSNLTLTAFYSTSGAELVLLNYNSDGSYTVISDTVYASNSKVTLPDPPAINKNWVSVSSGNTISNILNGGTALAEGDTLESSVIEDNDTTFSDISSNYSNGKYQLYETICLVAVDHYFATYVIDVDNCTFLRSDGTTLLDKSYYQDFEYKVPASFNLTLANGVQAKKEFTQSCYYSYDIESEISSYIQENLGNRYIEFSANAAPTFKYYDSSGTELTSDTIEDQVLTQDITVKISCTFIEQ